MSSTESKSESDPYRLTRRRALAGAAWTAPVIVVASAAPAFAASPGGALDLKPRRLGGRARHRRRRQLLRPAVHGSVRGRPHRPLGGPADPHRHLHPGQPRRPERDARAQRTDRLDLQPHGRQHRHLGRVHLRRARSPPARRSRSSPASTSAPSCPPRRRPAPTSSPPPPPPSASDAESFATGGTEARQGHQGDPAPGLQEVDTATRRAPPTGRPEQSGRPLAFTSRSTLLPGRCCLVVRQCPIPVYPRPRHARLGSCRAPCRGRFLVGVRETHVAVPRLRTVVGGVVASALALSGLGVATGRGGARLRRRPGGRRPDRQPGRHAVPQPGQHRLRRQPLRHQLQGRRHRVDDERGGRHDEPPNATTTIQATTTGAPLSSYSFDFQGSTGNLAASTLNVDSVTVNGVPATFSRIENTTHQQRVDRQPQAGRHAATPVSGAFTTVVTYHGAPVIHTDTDGSPEGWNNTTDGATFLNQPVGAMTLFPNNNTPRDKATYTFTIDAPTMLQDVQLRQAGGKPYQAGVASNGELISQHAQRRRLPHHLGLGRDQADGQRAVDDLDRALRHLRVGHHPRPAAGPSTSGRSSTRPSRWRTRPPRCAPAPCSSRCWTSTSRSTAPTRATAPAS